MTIKDFFVKYIVPIGSFILAIFSYTYYQKQQEAKKRAEDSNDKHDEQIKEVEEHVEDAKIAGAKVEEKIKHANAIVAEPVKVTDTLQDSVDDFNKS